MENYRTRQRHFGINIVKKLHKVQVTGLKRLNTVKNEAIPRTKDNNNYYWRHSVILAIIELEETL